MSESLSRKIKKSFVRTSLALCTLFAIAVTMAGCGDGDSADGSTPAKYFRYEKKGNVKDGEYIVIRGLNTVSDEIGNPKVNLEDIWKKYKGKIVIPSRIEGMPVREFNWNYISNQGGVKAPNTSVFIMNALDAEKAFYSAKEEEYNKLVTEIVFPEGIQEIYAKGLRDVMKVTIPLSVINNGVSVGSFYDEEIVVIQGNSEDDSLKGKGIFDDYHNVTLPECVKKVDLAQFRRAKKLTCSADAEFYYKNTDSSMKSIDGFKSKNPTEVIKKWIEKQRVLDVERATYGYKELTINGKKVLE